jgi:hypothetical protein
MSEDIDIELVKDRMFENKIKLKIKEEEYIIRYNNDANPIMINAYLLKMVEDTDKIIKVRKDNEFYIENVTETKKRIAFEEALSKKIEF